MDEPDGPDGAEDDLFWSTDLPALAPGKSSSGRISGGPVTEGSQPSRLSYPVPPDDPAQNGKALVAKPDAPTPSDLNDRAREIERAEPVKSAAIPEPPSGLEGLTRYLAQLRAEEERSQAEREREQRTVEDARMHARAEWEAERASLEAARARVLDAMDLVNATLALSGMRLDEEGSEATFEYDEELGDYEPCGITFRLRGRSCDAAIAVYATPDEIYVKPTECLNSSRFSCIDEMLEVDASAELIADRLADVIRWVLEQEPS
jgi:hypothetical protein